VKKLNHMQELRRLRRDNAKLKEKVAQLETFLGRGLPHKEVLDTYVRFVNMVGRAPQDAVLRARQEFFAKLEPWLQSFLVRKDVESSAKGQEGTAEYKVPEQEVESCSPQTESGALPSEELEVEATSESTPEATETEPTPSPTPGSSSEPGPSPDSDAS